MTCRSSSPLCQAQRQEEMRVSGKASDRETEGIRRRTRKQVSLGVCSCGWDRVYLRSSTMQAGFSRYSLHRLEKRHMVAPSMMR